MSDDIERRALNDDDYYHWYEYEGALTISSECCADGFSPDEERVLLRYLLNKHAQPSQLTTLRAEVEALRDEDHGTLADHDMYTGGLRYGRRVAYQTVLDLIDKHAREGQPDANH